MAVTLSKLCELAPRDRLRMLEHVMIALGRSAFVAPKHWQFACVVWTTEQTTVTDRAGFAAWLRANDLAPLAAMVANRHPKSRELLIYLDHDGVVSGVHVFAINIERELSSLGDEVLRSARNPTKENRHAR